MSIILPKMAYDLMFLESDLFTYNYFLQDNVCRLCWNTGNKLEDECFTYGKNNCLKNDLLDKIWDCLNLDLRNVSYPNKACKHCCEKIDEFSKFKMFCRESDKRLREIFDRYHSKNLNVVKDEKNDIICDTVHDSPADKLFLNFVDPNCIENVKYLTAENGIEQDNDVHNTFQFNASDDDTSDFLHENIKPITDKKLKENFNSKKMTKKVKCKSKFKHKTFVDDLIKKKSKYIPKRSASYCNICRTDFETKDNLSIHNTANHGIEEGNIFKCFGCEKRFQSRKARLAHELNFCKGLKEGYKCGKCDRYLPKRSMYEMHARDHRENPDVELPENIFQCAKCFELFKTKLCLKEHLLTHDSGKKKFVCETCGRVFMRQDYLYKHKLTHTGTKQHTCPHCDYKTAQKSSLTVHIRKHTGERPYSCDLCPQQCISSSNLRAHRRRHLGQKKFQCTICNKKFGYKISLEEHVASVHERSQSFPCEHCGAIYTRVRGLRRHLLAKHGKQDKSTEKTIKDGSTSLNKAENNDLYLKMVAEDSRNEKCKKQDLYEIKNNEQFLLMNSENSVVMTKMY